jgi:hypothetical protein
LIEDSQKERLRSYAWNYFALHAEQRMKTFHFYLIVSTVLVAGFINGTKDSSVDCRIISVLGLSLALISFYFEKLDERNRELVRNGEAALKYLDELENLKDNHQEPNLLKIFAHDDFVSQTKTNQNPLSFSYSLFLKCIFRTFCFIGWLAFIVCWIIFLTSS